jgi:hypothetical protein
MAQELMVASIRTDSGVQSREGINSDHVADMVETLAGGGKLPPVDVYKDPDGVLWLADGFHRLAAHEKAAKASIRCEVHLGTKADAAWHSCGANLAHGLRRTNADKRLAVEKAVRLRPTASIELLCQHCGVSHTFARAIKSQGVNRLPPVSRPETVTGKDGKTYPVPRPPWVARAEAAAATPVTPTPAARAAKPTPLTPARKPTPAPAAGEPDRVDAVGQPIPDHLEPLFDRAADITGLLGMLSNVRGAVKAGADDPLWSECDRQAAEAGIAQAYDAIKATAPYAVCPWCHGKAPMQRGCRGCGGRGALGRFRWDTAVPGEMKP